MTRCCGCPRDCGLPSLRTLCEAREALQEAECNLRSMIGCYGLKHVEGTEWLRERRRKYEGRIAHAKCRIRSLKRGWCRGSWCPCRRKAQSGGRSAVRRAEARLNEAQGHLAEAEERIRKSPILSAERNAWKSMVRFLRKEVERRRRRLDRAQARAVCAVDGCR